MSGFAGDGGPPPPPGQGSGRRREAMYGFDETITKTKDGKQVQYKQRLKTWFVPRSGKDKPILMLDPAGPRFTVRLHVFIGPDGKKGSMVRAIPKEPRGDPIAQALGSEGTWYWVLTGIDRSKFIPSEGSNKGKVYTNFRRLVLVTSQQYNDMVTIEEKDPEGWRGRNFDVSREASQTSYKIGTTWYPGSKMTDEEMYAEFAEAAENYGLPVEEFCAPVDYAKILKAPTYEEALKIAAAIEGTSGEDVTVPTGDEETVSY